MCYPPGERGDEMLTSQLIFDIILVFDIFTQSKLTVSNSLRAELIYHILT